MPNQTLAGELRATLAREQRSQLWLSQKTGINPTTLGRKLRGDVSFSTDELMDVASALGMSAAGFIAKIESSRSAA